jgi:hypothetical protein
MEGAFYEPDKRSVQDAGVQHVMKQFFAEHVPPQKLPELAEPVEAPHEDDVICDELLLAAFGEGKN